MKKNYKVWQCRLVIPEKTEFPKGFDLPLRKAVKDVISQKNIKVVACFSGWGGTVTDLERKVLED